MNGSALMPYREVNALAFVSDLAGLQARPENCYIGSPGSYIQVDLNFAQAHALPEVTYGGTYVNSDSNSDSNRRSPMGERHLSSVRIW